MRCAGSLGVDVGSHGVRCRLGETVSASAYSGAPPPARRDAGEIISAVDLALLALPAEARASVRTVGVTGVRGSVLGLGDDGTVATQVLPDFDPDSIGIARDLADRFGGELASRTGCPAFPLSGLPKLLRLARSRPDVARITTPADLVVFHLTGDLGLSQGAALRLGCLNADGSDLERTLLDELDLDASLFAPLVPVGGVMGKTRDGYLPAGLPVMACPGDGPSAQAICGGEGSVLVSLGTSTVAMVPLADGARFPDSGDVTVEIGASGRRLLEYGSGVGGAAVDWLARLVGSDPDALERGSRETEPGGIIVDPSFLSAWGEAPGATISGIPLGAAMPELAAAFLDAIGDDAADSVDRLRALGGRVERITLTGGCANSERVRAALTRRFGNRIRQAAITDGAARGAALVAASYAEVPDGP